MSNLFSTMTHKDTFFNPKRTLNIRGQIMDLSVPKVMGILNLTPDSFYSGSRVQSEKEILAMADKMLAEGADFLDLGAYSTRPDADDISEDEEAKRLIPMIHHLLKTYPKTVLSIDTFRAGIAEKAIEAGAHLINDVSGGTLDNDMFATVARLDVPYVLMHLKGTPKTMAKLNQYGNLTLEIFQDLSRKVSRLQDLGVKDIIIDPGFGFAKNIDQNYQLLNQLAHLKVMRVPILAGLSRKSMVWKTLKIEPSEALNGSTILNMVALQNGADILRVHDVKEAKECIAIFKKLSDNE